MFGELTITNACKRAGIDTASHDTSKEIMGIKVLIKNVDLQEVI